MRLLVANHTFAIAGGMEQYLAEILPLLAARGVDLRLLTEDPGLPAASFFTWQVGAGRDSATLAEIEHWKPDVVLVNGLRDPVLETALVRTFPAALLAHNYYGTCISGEKRHKAPVLSCCTRRFGKACLALYFPLRCGGWSVSEMASAYRLQDARHRLLDSYRSVLVLSKHMENEFRRNCRTTIVRLSPFVTPAPGLEPTRRSSRHLAFVGRMTALKGAAILLQSVHWLEQRRKQRVQLVMIGDGPLRPSLEGMAARMGLQADFLGWLQPSARDRAIAGAAAVVVPSLWPEPLGLVTLEAARLGVPTVGFAVGGLKEFVAEGQTGSLAPLGGDRVVNLARALERAVANVEAGGSWGANARKAIEGYRAERHVEGLLGALRAIARPSA